MTVDTDFSIEKYLARVRAQGMQKGFGWATLDGLEIGFNPGELAIIAGRTGHGKSTALMNILIYWMETYTDERFVLFSHEPSRQAVGSSAGCATTARIGGGLRGGSVVRAIEVVQCLQHGIGLWTGDRVVDCLRLAARLYQIVTAQAREMLRQCRLTEIDQPLQFTDRLFVLAQMTQDQEPSVVRQRLE